jgi:hypothetical protein
MNLRESRLALRDAVNAHDIETIKSFVDPSYAAKGPGGATIMGFGQVIEYATRIFAAHPEYREAVEIEGEEIEGPTGRLTTRRTETYKGSLGAQRTHVSRQVETWRQTDGRWVIVEECSAAAPEVARLRAWFRRLGDGAVPSKPSVGLLIACAVVVIASFLPWGSAPGQVHFGNLPVPVEFGQVTLTLTGWNGNLNPPG